MSRLRRWWLPALLFAGYVVQVGWRLWLCRSVPFPTVHPDEDGYLVAARALAGGPGGWTAGENPLFRRVGYPLLISPAYWFTDNPDTAFKNVQVINSLLNALTFPLAYLFARRVLAVARPWALALGFAAACIPSVIFYGEFAMIDTVWPPVGLAWLTMLYLALDGATAKVRTWAAAGAGAAAGFAFLLHVRGFVVLGVHLAAVVVLLLARRLRWKAALAAVGATVVMASFDWVLKAWLGDAIAVPDPGISESRMDVHLHTVLGLVATVSRALGQIWSITIIGWGLPAVGLVATVVWVARRGRTDHARWLVLCVAFVTTFGIAFMSATALPDDTRANHQMYQRYVAFLVPVWLMVGVVTLFGVGLRRAFWYVAGGLATMGGLLYIILAWNGRHMAGQYFIPWDHPEVAFLTNGYQHIRPIAATGAAVALLLVFGALLTWRRSAVLALAGLVVFNGVAITTMTDKVSTPMSVNEFKGEPRLASLGVVPGDVVAYSNSMNYIIRGHHERDVYWTRLDYGHYPWEPGQAAANATVMIGPWQTGEADPPGWHRVGVGPAPDRDPIFQWAVWRRNK